MSPTGFSSPVRGGDVSAQHYQHQCGRWTEPELERGTQSHIQVSGVVVQWLQWCYLHGCTLRTSICEWNSLEAFFEFNVPFANEMRWKLDCPDCLKIKWNHQWKVSSLLLQGAKQWLLICKPANSEGLDLHQPLRWVHRGHCPGLWDTVLCSANVNTTEGKQFRYDFRKDKKKMETWLVFQDDRERGSSVHRRFERRWLGSIKIPFSTVYFNSRVWSSVSSTESTTRLLDVSFVECPWKGLEDSSLTMKEKKSIWVLELANGCCSACHRDVRDLNECTAISVLQIDGTFRIRKPPVLLGYTHDPGSTRNGELSIGAGDVDATYITMFITIEPPPQAAEQAKEKVCTLLKVGIYVTCCWQIRRQFLLRSALCRWNFFFAHAFRLVVRETLSFLWLSLMVLAKNTICQLNCLLYIFVAVFQARDMLFSVTIQFFVSFCIWLRQV